MTLKKISKDKYSMQSNNLEVFQGTAVEVFCKLHDFCIYSKDFHIALLEMELFDHNTAEFGSNGTFMFTTND